MIVTGVKVRRVRDVMKDVAAVRLPKRESHDPVRPSRNVARMQANGPAAAREQLLPAPEALFGEGDASRQTRSAGPLP